MYEITTASVSAFSAAYDLYSWILFIGGCLSVSGTMMVLSFHKGQMRWSFWSALALAMSFIVDQCYMRTRHSKQITVLFAITVFVWAEVSMVLNTGYKGYIIRSLAFPQPPDVPTDLEGLGRSSVFTFSNMFLTTGTGRQSYFRLKTKFILDNWKNDSHSDDVFKSNLQSFDKKLQCFPNHVVRLVVLQTSRASVTRKASLKNVYIPQSHIFVGSNRMVTKYMVLMNLLVEAEQRHGFILGNMLSEFSVRKPLYAQANFLLPFLNRKALHIMEFGIFQVWDMAYDAHQVVETLDQGILLAQRVNLAVRTKYKLS